MPMIYFEKNKKINMTTAINMALYFKVNNALCSARNGFFAPRFCPTKVVAALLNPQAGKIKKTTFRIAI